MPGASELARIEIEENEQNGPDMGLPLALGRPQLFGDINIRVALVPAEDAEDQKLLALAQTFPGVVLQSLMTKMRPGKIELDITDGYGKQRSMQLTPAELIVLLQMAEKFVQELPN